MVEIRSQAETLPLRQDMVTLLSYGRDYNVVGTRSAGNLPLKAIREVTAHIVDPPMLDRTPPSFLAWLSQVDGDVRLRGDDSEPEAGQGWN